MTLILPEWFVYMITIAIWAHIALSALRIYLNYLKAKWVKEFGSEYPEYKNDA